MVLEVRMVSVIVVLLLTLDLLIVVHHHIIHPELSGLDRFFQISDISNHETWIVGILFFIIGYLLRK